MERKPDESFADYKERRAIANRAVKRINEDSRGGSVTSRQKQRQERDNSKHAGAYGENLRAAFAKWRATVARLATHTAYLASMEARRAARLGESVRKTVLLAA